jgi:hypothetical protein
VKVRQLIESWQSHAGEHQPDCVLQLPLTGADHAKLHALAEIYPGRDVETLARELLQAALFEVEEAMPYVPGPKAIGEGESGDPVYEDIGPTPRFLELARRYLEQQ